MARAAGREAVPPEAAPDPSSVTFQRGTPLAMPAILALQRSAGNQAVERILARDAQAGTSLKAPPAAKSTRRADKDPEVTQAQLQAVQDRAQLERLIENRYDDIYDLRKGIIDTWQANAHAEDPPNRWSQFIVGVLGVIIAIVSEGVGGIAYGLIQEAMQPGQLHALAKEFVYLASLEAGDLAAEIPLHLALERVEEDLVKGGARARGDIRKTFTDDALQKIADANKSDAINTYAAVMRLQAHLENDATKEKFNEKSTGKTVQELRELWAAQKLTHDLILHNPARYLQELTLGYAAMLDRAQLAEQSRKTSEADVLQKDANHEILSVGILELKPDKPGEYYGHMLGKWSAPDLDFPGFRAGVRGVNHALDRDLVGIAPRDLPPMTIRVQFRARNAYSGVFAYQRLNIVFVIDRTGQFHVTEGGDHREWLSSYYTGLSREHSSEERARYAPLGAAKLWDAMKAKPVLWAWDDD